MQGLRIPVSRRDWIVLTAPIGIVPMDSILAVSEYSSRNAIAVVHVALLTEESTQQEAGEVPCRPRFLEVHLDERPGHPAG